MLGVAEALVLVSSLYAGVSIRFMGIGIADKLLSEPLLFKAVMFASVMLCMMVSTGLYQQDLLRENSWNILARILVSFGLGVLAMSLIFYAFPNMFIGRASIALAFAVAMLGIGMCRYVYYTLIGAEVLKRRVLVLGVGEQAGQIAALRRKTDRVGINIIGFVAVPGETCVIDKSQNMSLDTRLPVLVRRYEVDELIIATDDQSETFPLDEVIECKLCGVQTLDLLTFLERQTGKIYLGILHPSNIIFLDGFSQAVLRSYTKRLFDILVSIIMLILCSPIMMLAALAVVLESAGVGPVFFRQERVGKNGEIFEVIKFRSMRVDAEKDGVARWATQNDSRITLVGGFLRKTRIDELPQLINVLRGDMSFVGPRPERPVFVQDLSRKVPFFAMRHRVNPGITGWAQIRYPYGASVEDAQHKLQYDLYYIKNYSLFLDITILLQTIQVILWGQGR